MRIKYISIVIISAFLIGGCKKDYFDINEVNPNQTQYPPLNGLLASVTYQTAINVYRAGDFTSYYMQYLASPNQGGASDIYENADRSSLWFNTTTTGENPYGGVYNTVVDGRVLEQKA